MKIANETSSVPSRSPLTDARLAQRLTERGIAQAATDAGWRPFWHKRPKALGWSYPIYDPETEKVIRDPATR